MKAVEQQRKGVLVSTRKCPAFEAITLDGLIPCFAFRLVAPLKDVKQFRCPRLSVLHEIIEVEQRLFQAGIEIQ
ncbi:hypothetical protein D3C87_2034590 [compost metagenome]